MPSQSDHSTRATFLPYALPSIGEEEIAEVVNSLRSGWITTGPKVQVFETDFAEYIGASHTIAVNSCTGGLLIALRALGVGAGDEVIVPTLTFCSTANVVVHLGARPVLVDIGEDFNVTPEAVEAAVTDRTAAIIPVHYGGQPCDLEAIYSIAAEHGVHVVEDAAHSVGSSYQNNQIGSDELQQAYADFHRVTVFSFYAIKNMTTGEGGMITTPDPELTERMRRLVLHGMSRDAWKRYSSKGSWFYEVIEAGYKYNMSDVQASIGIHQLRKLDGFVNTRKRYAQMYDDAFRGLPSIEIPITYPDRDHVYHLYEIRLNLENLTIDRDQFIEELRNRNIGTSVHFIPVHLHPFYRDQYSYRVGDFPNAEGLFERIVSLPLYPAMTENDVQSVIEVVGDVLSSNSVT